MPRIEFKKNGVLLEDQEEYIVDSECNVLHCPYGTICEDRPDITALFVFDDRGTEQIEIIQQERNE